MRSQEVKSVGSIISLTEQIEAHIMRIQPPVSNFNMQVIAPNDLDLDYEEINKFTMNVMCALNKH